MARRSAHTCDRRHHRQGRVDEAGGREGGVGDEHLKAVPAIPCPETVRKMAQRRAHAARYRVVGEDGAIVREGVELHTPVVGELRFLDEVISAELTPDSRNATRVRLVGPMKGWATLRCFEQIESAESYAASVEGARLLECERREELNRAAIEMQRQRVIDERTSSSSAPAATSVNALQDNQQRRGETSYYYAHYDKDVTIATTPTKIEPQQHGTSSAPPDDSNDALRNNLRLKGMASYYYAHSRKDDGICFETAPQKLDRAPSDEGQLLVPTESIMDYSFSDEAERVVVRIPLKAEDAVHLEWTEHVVKLEIVTQCSRAILRLPAHNAGPFLWQSISSVRSKRKPDRLVLFIKKA